MLQGLLDFCFDAFKLCPICSYVYGPCPFRQKTLLLWIPHGQCSRVVPSILLDKWVVQFDSFTKTTGIYTFQEIKLRTLTDRTCPSLISHKSFPDSGEVAIVRRPFLSSPLHFTCDIVNRFLGLVSTVLGVIEAQYWFFSSFIFWELFSSGSGI